MRRCGPRGVTHGCDARLRRAFAHRCMAYETQCAINCGLPPWPNGQGVGLLIRRLRVRVPQGVPYCIQRLVGASAPSRAQSMRRMGRGCQRQRQWFEAAQVSASAYAMLAGPRTKGAVAWPTATLRLRLGLLLRWSCFVSALAPRGRVGQRRFLPQAKVYDANVRQRSLARIAQGGVDTHRLFSLVGRAPAQ